MNIINKDIIEDLKSDDVIEYGLEFNKDFVFEGESSIVPPLTEKDVMEMGLPVE